MEYINGRYIFSYGLANWVYQTLQQQNTDQCIFLNGKYTYKNVNIINEL